MAHERILGLACFQELHDRILAGVSLKDIVTWLQVEKQEFTEVKSDSVYKAISRYKQDIPAAELDLIDGKVTQTRLEEIEGDLDELDALHRLFNLQMRRITRMEAREAQTGGVMNLKLAQDVDEARKLLVQSAELKFKLGIYKEQMRSVTVNHEFTTTRLIEQLSPEERRRAGALAQSILPELARIASGPIPEAEDIPFELVTNSTLSDHAPDSP